MILQKEIHTTVNGREKAQKTRDKQFSSHIIGESIYIHSEGAKKKIAGLLTTEQKRIEKATIMSFLFGGPPKVSSAEKIAAAEIEVEMVSDMFNR